MRFLAYSDTPRRPIPWRKILRTALPLWLFTRLFALALTYLSWTLLRASVTQSPCRSNCAVSLNSIVNAWRMWDGGFYSQILLHGYDPHKPINAAFWPLYPLLVKPFEIVLGPGRWQIALLRQ